MNIVICIDYSTFTEKILNAAKKILDVMMDPKISVVHVVDETQFFATTGFETQQNIDVENENNELKELVVKYLGNHINYIEEYGIPRMKIDEILSTMNYDLLIIGSHSKHGLGNRLMGGMAEHLLHNSQQPVLFIP